jgi:hypothetical protein
MDSLPAFAAVLRERNNLRKSTTFSPRRDLFLWQNDAGDPAASAEMMAQLDGLLEIRKDLERQLSDMLAGSAMAPELRIEIEHERQINMQLRTNIEETREKLKEVRLRNLRLEDQVRQGQQQLDNKRHQAHEKDKIFVQLQTDYATLSSDYRKLCESNLEQQKEIGSTSLFTQDFVDDFNSYRPEPYVSVSVPLDHTEGVHTESPNPVAPVVSLTKTTPFRTALVDNIFFGDIGELRAPDALDGVSIEELRATVDKLQKEKAEIEWQVQRAIPPGVSVSRARREKQEQEDQLDELAKKLGRVKLAIRQRNAK